MIFVIRYLRRNPGKIKSRDRRANENGIHDRDDIYNFSCTTRRGPKQYCNPWGENQSTNIKLHPVRSLNSNRTFALKKKQMMTDDNKKALYDGDGIFSVNLLEKSKQHISFLKDLHSLGVTIRRPSSKSLERYRDLWLPLIYQYNNDGDKKTDNGAGEDCHRHLIPPPDVAWLFHCHRLAPYRYASYCRKKFRITDDRQIPDANPPFSFQMDDGRVHCGTRTESEDTQNLWKQLYPDEPFFLQEEFLQKEGENDDRSLRIDTSEEGKGESSSSLLLDGFDLLGSTDRQSTFLWQVSGPRFSDDEFLKDGIGRYHKFILLRKRVQDERRLRRGTTRPRTLGIIVPTYQIDLMWHTHMLSGFHSYHGDCKSILGGLTLNHDDGLNDRSEGGTLDVAFRETKVLWRSSYGENYTVQGGMYRGEPPKSYYSTEWDKSFQPSGCPLIGIHGASSINALEDTSPRQVSWTPLSGTAPDGSPGFISAAPKSTSYGVNANPFRQNYIFGRKGSQVGYFHITTKAAYEVLERRIASRVMRKEDQIAMMKCCTCNGYWNSKRLKEKEDKLETMRDIQLIARKRAEAAGPDGDVRLPEHLKKDRSHFSREGEWHFLPTYYAAGGGCGFYDAGAYGGGGDGGVDAGACGGGACRNDRLES